VVFLAELGDKSQLITMTYALRHRWWLVLSGVAIAAFAIHGISVTVGHFLGLTLPARPIAAVAGVAFIGFAAWTWREGNSTASGEGPVHEPRFVLFAVVSSVLLAELGDKTMLATVALASDRPWPGVWLGATAGMVLADAVAIAVGTVLHRRLPEHLLHGAAALLFLVFGLWMLLDEALGWRPVAIAAIAGLVSVALAAVLRRVALQRRGQTAGGDSIAR
jgi:putative Ca2+/H+ antiporter (TMEM165/GDT1 family)